MTDSLGPQAATICGTVLSEWVVARGWLHALEHSVKGPFLDNPFVWEVAQTDLASIGKPRHYGLPVHRRAKDGRWVALCVGNYRLSYDSTSYKQDDSFHGVNSRVKSIGFYLKPHVPYQPKAFTDEGGQALAVDESVRMRKAQLAIRISRSTDARSVCLPPLADPSDGLLSGY